MANRDFNKILANMSTSDLSAYVKKCASKWMKQRGKEYLEQIREVISDYAAQVDIAKDFREDWNNSHPPWDRYKDKYFTSKFHTGEFAKNVKYKIKQDGVTVVWYNDTQPDPPLWGSYHKKQEDDLSTWIEGDENSDNSYIHPLPPYRDVHGDGSFLVFSTWFEKSEWMNMWYTKDPYMDKAFQDVRVQQILYELNIDFSSYLQKSIIKDFSKK